LPNSLVNIEKASANMHNSIYTYQLNLTSDDIIKISNLIHTWNINNNYSKLNCNCKTFILSLLQELNIKEKINWESKLLGKYLNDKLYYDNFALSFRTLAGNKLYLDTEEEVDKYIRNPPVLNDEEKQLANTICKVFSLEKMKLSTLIAKWSIKEYLFDFKYKL